MLARVRVGDHMLALMDDRKWRSRTLPNIAESLTYLHADTFGEENGEPGRWQAHDAARRLGGEVIKVSKS